MKADSQPSSIWAILPVKQIGTAKQRLSNILSAAERQELFRNMLVDVMAAIAEARSLAGLLVVTREVEVQFLVSQYGARVLPTDTDDGQSAAVTAAAATLSREGVSEIITLAGDVPLMTAAEIDTVCDSLSAAPAMTIVPNWDETGTNSIACSPPHLVPFKFGESSFHRHLRTARAQGIEPNILPLTGMALDIDTAADLLELMRRKVATVTQRFLISSGIAERLDQQLISAPRHEEAVDSRVRQ